MPTVVARVRSSARNAVMLACFAFAFIAIAFSDAVRPALFFDVLQARGIIRKFGIEISKSIALCFRERLFSGYRFWSELHT